MTRHNERCTKPNPDFTKFPPRNLFIEHLKCIDVVL
jgi:hypothetical protein